MPCSVRDSRYFGRHATGRHFCVTSQVKLELKDAKCQFVSL